MDNKELINSLKEIISMIAGKQSEDIAELIYSNKHVNEFLIAKKLNLTINQTRNILYKIADYGMVSSIRKKDKKKGWYTYFWKLEVLKALEFLREMIIKNIEQLNSQIKSREEKQFYVCEICKTEYNEENALLRDFTCQECGNVFALKDNAPVIREMRKQLAKLSRELEIVDDEIKKEKEKEGKLKEKETRVAEKIKKKEKTKKKGKTAPKKNKEKVLARKIKKEKKKTKKPVKKKNPASKKIFHNYKSKTKKKKK